MLTLASHENIKIQMTRDTVIHLFADKIRITNFSSLFHHTEIMYYHILQVER